MNVKHTPGPCHIEQCAGMISVNSSDGKTLAVIEPWMATSPQEREANAYLIRRRSRHAVGKP